MFHQILDITYCIYTSKYQMGYVINMHNFMFSYINLKINLKARGIALLGECLPCFITSTI